MAQSLESDQQQPPAKPPEHSLFSRSGFMDGLKGVGQTASKLAHSAVEKGQEIANSQTGQRIQAQAAETTHQVMASPITKHVMASAEKSVKQEYATNVSHINGAVAAGKRGDLLGVARNAAPVALEVAAPGKVIAGTAIDIAADQAPASQRASIKHVTDIAHGVTGHGLTNLTITGLEHSAESQAMQHVKQKAMQTALETPHPEHPANQQTDGARRQADMPLQTASSPVSTADFVQALKKKIQAKQLEQKQAGNN
jgi:hypothetical protein